MRRSVTVSFAAALFALAPAPAHATWPGANGRIAFGTLNEHGAQLRTSTLGGRRERVVARFEPLPIGLERKSGFPEWRPDGARVLYQRMATGIESVRDDGRRTAHAEDVAPVPRLVAGRPPSRRGRGRAPALRPRRLAAGRLSQAADRRTAGRQPGAAALVPHGSSGSSSSTPRRRASFVWRVRPNGRGMRRLVRGNLHTWAPDGRRFAYSDGRDIWVGPRRRPRPPAGPALPRTTRPSRDSRGRPTPVPEHLFWIVSRGAGISALLLSSASVALGLMMSGRLARSRAKEPAPAARGALARDPRGARPARRARSWPTATCRPRSPTSRSRSSIAYEPAWTGAGIVAGWMLAILGLLVLRPGADRGAALALGSTVSPRSPGCWPIGHSLGAGSDADRCGRRRAVVPRRRPLFVARLGAKAAPRRRVGGAMNALHARRAGSRASGTTVTIVARGPCAVDAPPGGRPRPRDRPPRCSAR